MSQTASFLFVLFLFVAVKSHQLSNGFSCDTETFENEYLKTFEVKGICAPNTGCNNRDFINNYPTPIGVLVDIVFYGVDCLPADVAGFEAKANKATANLNKGFAGVGVFFRGSSVILPCRGKSGTYDMTSPNDAMIKDFLSKEVNPLQPRKFQILSTRADSTVGYAGFHYLFAKRGMFVYGSLDNYIVGTHELGHGFGLQHTFYRTTSPISQCECAENSNIPSSETGDYCEDTPGCPQTQSRSWTIPTTSLSNGCPKNETFWNNPVNNIMSYNFGPAPEFTSCQMKRMRCVWENNFKANTDYIKTSDLTCFGKAFNESCSKNGICIGNDTCVCDTGYYGDQCQSYNCSNVPFNSPKACSGFGNCTAPNTCVCGAGYTLSDCSRYYCYGTISTSTNVCTKFGKCVASDKCECNPGYFGSKCEDFKCFGFNKTDSTGCSNRGSCTGADICKCNTGFGGNKCHLSNKNSCYGFNAISPNACFGHGDCLSNNNCTCFEGYNGLDCSTYQCFGVNATNYGTVCGGNGNCTFVNNCTCFPGWIGKTCDISGSSSVQGNLLGMILFLLGIFFVLQ